MGYMKTLDSSVQVDLVKRIRELFALTLEVPFETLEQLPVPQLVREILHLLLLFSFHCSPLSSTHVLMFSAVFNTCLFVLPAYTLMSDCHDCFSCSYILLSSLPSTAPVLLSLLLVLLSFRYALRLLSCSVVREVERERTREAENQNRTTSPTTCHCRHSFFACGPVLISNPSPNPNPNINRRMFAAPRWSISTKPWPSATRTPSDWMISAVLRCSSPTAPQPRRKSRHCKYTVEHMRQIESDQDRSGLTDCQKQTDRQTSTDRQTDRQRHT